MRYIQPQILRNENAASAIQSVARTSNKPVGQLLDNIHTQLTTPNAYEADE
jgi:hypothetical protein